MPDDEIVPPLFLSTAPTWEVAEVARLIAGDGLTETQAQAQVRRFAKLRWIHSAGKRGSGATAANLFPVASVAAAKVLSTLLGMGLRDTAPADPSEKSVLGHASVALFAWDQHQPRVRGVSSPILAAMGEAASDRMWVYQIRFLYHDQTGERHVQAWVYDPDEWTPPPPAPSSGFIPRGSLMVHLAPLLLPLQTRIMADLNKTAAWAN